jgi:calcineurin-like phosphoesterase family protein
MPRLRVPLALALLVAVTSVVLSCGDPPSAAPRAGSIVWAVGDGGNGSDEARTLERVIGRDNPRRVLYLGDVYEHGTATDFRERFETVYGPLKARMEPTPGNHDWPNHRTGYDPYWHKPHHYAFSLAGWRIISLNSETPDNRAQLRFLRGQVKGRRCVLAFMHRPRFNAGMHHNEERDVEKLWQALRGHARLLLAGHDHDLQRFKRIDGTTQFVIGAGGRERYAVNGADPRLAYSNDRVDGALRMQLQPGVARLRIVRADGRVLDRSTVRC